MEDLSSLAKDSMWCTSQAAGNRQSKSALAMTAPGSSPVDRELPSEQMADPHVNFSNPEIPTGTDGKPQASGQTGPYKPGPPKWGPCSIPTVIRKDLGETDA
jgi:hypothetical protein